MTWQCVNEVVSVGIDIGWSRTRKSCAVAIQGAAPTRVCARFKQYSRGNLSPIYLGLFTKAELIDALPDLFTSIGSRRMSVVLDGPVGRNGLANQNRHVDESFCRGEFYRRMQPSPVESGSGPVYAAAVDEIVHCIYTAVQRVYKPAWWDGNPVTSLTICETHPTVGLALLLPPQLRDSIASRSCPKVIRERTIGQKSDWYWQLGAGRWVAEELQAPDVANECHHERVAGLYCLAVAARLSEFQNEKPTVAAIGNADGVYVIPTIVDTNWENALRGVGVYFGELTANDQAAYMTQIASPPIVIQTESYDGTAIDESDDAERGDEVWLTLRDNGGIWRNHNDWLENLEPPLCFRTIDRLDELVRIIQAKSDGQWKSENSDQTPRKLAKKRGFAGEHLSEANQFRIPIKLANCEPEQ